MGSEVSFLWGPPGTGKTFAIASLVASLIQRDETVLVTSHTHAAVEQALRALIERPEDGRTAGPLFDSQLVSDGRILKVGPLRSKEIPRSVHLNSYLEDLAEERDANIATLEREQQRLVHERELVQGHLDPWRNLRKAEAAHDRATTEHENASRAREGAVTALEAAQNRVADAQTSVAKASHSFFFGRGGRVTKARAALEEARQLLLKAEASAGRAEADYLRKRPAEAEASMRLDQAQLETEGLADPERLEEQAADLDSRLETLEAEIRALRELGDEEADTLVENAAALFATLTKLYMDRTKISELQWDTVILDEASMAMPPLVAYAASRARKRMIVVGDMYQLPPVVHSPDDGAGSLLGKDIFELRGITTLIEGGDDVPELVKLNVQRRMHPAIAEVSKNLIPAYRDLQNAPETIERHPPDALGTTDPLVVVDIAGLNPWSGKMPGSLSRFNFLSGQVAAELATLYASALPEPAEKTPPQIGIVTPYAAQRRYLNKLIQTMRLERWVTAGTVHTFQGNECDVIIFDSVLGEPHWSARLTNPHDVNQVLRDLNVAITRARRQFVFVGDSDWLRKHAKPDSALGKLWAHLGSAAQSLDAITLLGEGFRGRVGQSSREAQGWNIDNLPKSVQLLGETEFYPALTADLSAAKRRVVLYTPFIGKTRWPTIEPHIMALRERGVEVYLLHKPLTDREWKQSDPDFGYTVFEALQSSGVKLIPLSGVHAKTIVIDSRVVYEGSLNWASQTSSYEHMWRFDSKDMARLVERMLQLEPLVEAYASDGQGAARCPKCDGPLMLINQARQANLDAYPVKLGCFAYSESKELCAGYLRRVDGRAPFKTPPVCARGSLMVVHYTKAGRPWDWRCGHKGCKPIRWARGDCETG